MTVAKGSSNLDPDHISIANNPDCISGIRLYTHTEYSIVIGQISLDNVYSGHLSALCISMVLTIVTTVFMARSDAPFLCEATEALNLIFCCFFNWSYINAEALKIPLSVWYLLITTPWLWASLSKVSFYLTVSVAFIFTWCLMLT